MLILQRKAGESIQIGDNITITVAAIEGNRVRLAINAPREISVLRNELLEAKEANQDSAVEAVSNDELHDFLSNVLNHKNPQK